MQVGAFVERLCSKATLLNEPMGGTRSVVGQYFRIIQLYGYTTC